MRIVFFVHSLVSDWNHGNAHFLRGLVGALQDRGHRVTSCERWRNWSTDGLFEQHGHGPIVEFTRRFPRLDVQFYGDWDSITEELEELTRGADVVVVHEFNDPRLIGALGRIRRQRTDLVLLFHDTHHRAVTAPAEIASMDLSGYDGTLAFGDSLARIHRRNRPGARVWTFHEAADISVFRPLENEKTDDVVWIGNWGDGERSGEVESYLLASARALPELRFAVHGVRYPDAARDSMATAGIDYRGWIPNYRVPEVFARARMTLHIPRGPYLDALPGIPTIRPFEALACGIPLVSTAWDDSENLFRRGVDHIVVRSPEEALTWIRTLARDEDARQRLIESGLETIRRSHTCHHRAEQLEEIIGSLSQPGRSAIRT